MSDPTIYRCYRWLRQVSVILFLNKIDLLEEKIRHGKTLKMLTDRLEPDNAYRDQFELYHDWEGPKGEQRIQVLRPYLYSFKMGQLVSVVISNRRISSIFALLCAINTEVV